MQKLLCTETGTQTHDSFVRISQCYGAIQQDSALRLEHVLIFETYLEE